MRLAVALFMPLVLLACGGALADGKAQFKKGRYVEAKHTFDAIEHDTRVWDDPRRAEYALYRGLTLGALGDRAAAGVWLHEAKAIADARPGTLSAEDLQRLRLALEMLAPDKPPPSALANESGHDAGPEM
jgi:hypothetical protein